MKKIVKAVIFLLLMVSSASAGTLTVTASGFSTLSAGAPANWPANVTFPALGNPNGSKTYTVNDTDWLFLLTWVAANQYNNFTAAAPATPTAPQLLLSWLQIWVNGTKSSVSQFLTTPPVVPAPITIQ